VWGGGRASAGFHGRPNKRWWGVNPDFGEPGKANPFPVGIGDKTDSRKKIQNETVSRSGSYSSFKK